MTVTTTTKSLNAIRSGGRAKRAEEVEGGGQKVEDLGETKPNRAKASIKLHKLQPYTDKGPTLQSAQQSSPPVRAHK